MKKVFMYLDDDVFAPDGYRKPENFYLFLNREDLITKMNSFDEKILVENVEQAQEYIKANGCPHFISFDNDLQRKLEGIHLAHWLVENDLDNPGFIPDDFSFTVHSQNSIAAPRIISYLESYLQQRKPVVRNKNKM